MGRTWRRHCCALRGQLSANGGRADPAAADNACGAHTAHEHSRAGSDFDAYSYAYRNADTADTGAYGGHHADHDAGAVLPTDDYADTAGKSRQGTQAGHGQQAGDPVRGARAIIAAIESERPPVHLLIGGDALDQLRGKLDELRQETDAWEDVTRSTDFRLRDS